MSPESEDTRVDRSAAGAPRRLGRFETVRLLGRGGMGSVYLAEDPKIGRQVAIKEIRIERGGGGARRGGGGGGAARGGRGCGHAVCGRPPPPPFSPPPPPPLSTSPSIPRTPTA